MESEIDQCEAVSAVECHLSEKRSDDFSLEFSAKNRLDHIIESLSLRPAWCDHPIGRRWLQICPGVSPFLNQAERSMRWGWLDPLRRNVITISDVLNVPKLRLNSTDSFSNTHGEYSILAMSC